MRQYPSYLKPGDKVVLLSPAGVVDPSYVVGAVETLSSWGLDVVVGDVTLDRYGRFAGDDTARLADINAAINDRSVRAIFATRGGYGAIRLIDKINFEGLTKDPKWMVGFSDITLLHGAWTRHGVCSVHAPMAQHLTKLPLDKTTDALKAMLFGEGLTIKTCPEPENREGEAKGKLVGGNLAVMSGMVATDIDFDYNGSILFIEEISEPMYKIERMLYQLKMSGVLKQLSALIVGQFTDCPEDEGMNESMRDMFARFAKEISGPIVYNFPVGHVDNNYPLMEGGDYHLKVEATQVVLEFIK